MSGNLKALIVILGVSLPIFHFAKPIALTFCSEEDFIRRKTVWLGLTIMEFLSPDFWLFTFCAAPLLVWSARKDKNPTAFYLFLLNAVPIIHQSIPMIGINYLFDLDNYRLLSLCVLVPAAWRLRKSGDFQQSTGKTTMSYLLIGYGALHVLYYVPPDLPGHIPPPDSLTNLARRGFLFLIDVWVLFYVVSRSLNSRIAITDCLFAFVVSCLIMAVVAMFESSTGWLLYINIVERFGNSNDHTVSLSYLMRGNFLRAQASAGHSLALGFALAIATGFWLFLKRHVRSKFLAMVVTSLLWLGLLAAYARGCWIGAVAVYFAYAGFGPNAAKGVFKAAVACALFAVVVSVSPLGPRILSVLPFISGQPDLDLSYRQLIIERALHLIPEHPYFGDQLAIEKMQDLRQGQGIIDIVNVYAGEALFYGLVGLAFFVGLMLTGMLLAFRASKKVPKLEVEFRYLGASIIACCAGTLLMIENCSFTLGLAKLYFVLAGLAVSYAQCGNNIVVPDVDRNVHAARISAQ